MANNKLVLKNTILLYVRMFVMLGLSLFTTRVIFQALGIQDMGLYNLVGGVLSMIGFLNNSMVGATNRFLAYELGRGDKKELDDTFGLVLLIHVLLAVIVIIISETLGLWFVNNYLVIAPNRLAAANWVYQVAILSCAISIFQVPFTASITAHEKMGIYAYFSLIDVIIKLLIVYLLLYLPGDRLITYALLLFASNVIYFIFNLSYSITKFVECRFHFVWERDRFVNIFSFSGWNLVGQATIIGNEQILNIFLNWFFGTAVNGARGITSKVNSTIAQFVYQFQTAIKPAIIKSYAVGDIENVEILVSAGMKMSFLLMCFFSFPIIIEIDPILSVWLGEIPQYTSWFIRLTIINTLVDTMTGSLETCLQATGNIKRVQIYTSFILWSILPLSYLLLYIGCEPYMVMIINILTGFFTLYVRMGLVDEQVGISRYKVIRNTVMPSYFAALLAFIPPYVLWYCLENDLLAFVSVCMLSLVCSLLCSYFIAFNIHERKLAHNIVIKIFRHFIR